MNILLPALSLGFLGSFHCLGMCGPIALALPVTDATPLKRIMTGIIYNSGRITTYALFGILFGLIGERFVLAGYQQVLSVSMGVLILCMILLPKRILSGLQLSAVVYSFIGALKSRLGLLLKKRSFQSFYFIGILNGLLPCGLVYLGIAGSVATGNYLKGALFMMFFGIGTFPVMFGITVLRSRISLGWRERVNRTIPVFVTVMAILLILRGMNLGIPYVSPQLGNISHEPLKCCHR
jgi:hypothetical protein